MQVVLPLQTVVDEAGFTPLPNYLIALAASLIALAIARRIGKRVSSNDSTFGNLLVNLLTLISAGSVVASISETPFVVSVSDGINQALGVVTDEGVQLSGLAITGALVLGIIVAILGYLFIKSESRLWLILFGLGLQALAVFNPWIGSALSWWINNPIQWLWNFIVGILTGIPNITINF